MARRNRSNKNNVNMQRTGINSTLNAGRLVGGTVDNMAKAEARTHEKPLWTPKTAELQRRANEEGDK